MKNLLEVKSLSGENTVVVIDHDMEFIRRLDSNVSVLNQGTVSYTHLTLPTILRV